MIEQEYYSLNDLVKKLGLNPSEQSTLRQKAYRRKIPGAKKIMGKWRFRICEIEMALAKGGF